MINDALFAVAQKPCLMISLAKLNAEEGPHIRYAINTEGGITPRQAGAAIGAARAALRRLEDAIDTIVADDEAMTAQYGAGLAQGARRVHEVQEDEGARIWIRSEGDAG